MWATLEHVPKQLGAALPMQVCLPIIGTDSSNTVVDCELGANSH